MEIASGQTHRLRGNILVFNIIVLLALCLLTHAFDVTAQTGNVRFAVIGDYGSGDNNERDVANLVKSWNPDFIITTGDNNYPDGEAATIDRNIGQFYREFIFPYTGTYGPGATVNRFFPSLGNHDWENRIGPPAQPYKDYFSLPHNERYYDFVQGSVHFFVIDSDEREPDGVTSTSIQANWLRTRLAASTARWKIVYMHHPPFSSRASHTDLQWPYQEWGASAVLAGHAHVYERVMRSGFPYFTNGLGGESTGTFGTPISGSVVRFGNDFGAQLVTASSESITFQFITRTGQVVDTFSISTVALVAPTDLTANSASSDQINISWTDNSNNEDGFKIERCQNAGCTDFSEIANVAANVRTYSDGGLATTTTYRYRVQAFDSGGGSSYSNIAQATTSAAGSTLLSDDFDDGIRDVSKWNVGILSRSSSNFDPLVPVAEQNGRLSISPRASITSNSYSGYVSVATLDLTDKIATVEVVQKAAGNAATIFSVGPDKDNWHGFRAKGNTLFLESRRAGSTTSVNISYNVALHRYWRLRHDLATNVVAFDTSPDAVAWITQRTLTNQIPLTLVKAELIAGTGESVSAPGTALFDNFSVRSSSVSIILNAPSGLVAEAAGASRIDLSWTDNSTDEDGFRLERCRNAECSSFTQIAETGANVTSFSDGGLSELTTFRYRVRAYRSAVTSAYSAIVEATTTAAPPSLPAAPSNLAANGVSTGQINLNWSVNSSNEDGFKIERCQDSGCANFLEIAQVGVDVDSFVDSGLSELTTYSYRVRAFNSVGESPFSNVAEGSTLSASAPAAPSDLFGTPVSQTHINISWTDNSADESSFKIERCQNANCVDFAEIAQVGADTNTYSDSTVTAGQIYRYQVRAFSTAGGNSAYSNAIEVSTPSPPLPPARPANLTGAAASSSQINLTWSDNSLDEEGFKIERCQNANCIDFVEIAQAGANATQYSDTGITGAQTYRYRVRSFNTVGGNSSYSNIVDVTPPVTPIQVFGDNFDDNFRDGSKWALGLVSRGSSNFDPLVSVAEQNGRLMISPRISESGSSYSGYLSVSSWPMEGSYAVVELVQKTSGNAVTIFSVGIDNGNWFGFRAKGSTLYLENRLDSSTSGTSIPYDPIQHRFWRIRHDPIADWITFETSPEGSNWTIRRTVTRQISLAAIRIELVSGTTGSVSSPGTAIFDNFQLVFSDTP